MGGRVTPPKKAEHLQLDNFFDVIEEKSDVNNNLKQSFFRSVRIIKRNILGTLVLKNKLKLQKAQISILSIANCMI